MPKNGLPEQEWRLRLQQYAAGTFKFRKGQKPRKESRWAIEFDKIDKCPMKTAAKSLFGQATSCSCGYEQFQRMVRNRFYEFVYGKIFKHSLY